MSSARHRERQHKRIISTTSEVENLEHIIKSYETAIDALHRQPLPHRNAAAAAAAAAVWGSNRQSDDTGDAPPVRSNPVAVSPSRCHHPLVGEMIRNSCHGEFAEEPNSHYAYFSSETKHPHGTATAELAGKLYDASGITNNVAPGSIIIRQDKDCACLRASPPLMSGELVHTSIQAMAQSIDAAAPWSSDAV
ncbi:hypothetical protein GGI24_005151, partial [Coemansia furcata]